MMLKILLVLFYFSITFLASLVHETLISLSKFVTKSIFFVVELRICFASFTWWWHRIRRFSCGLTSWNLWQSSMMLLIYSLSTMWVIWLRSISTGSKSCLSTQFNNWIWMFTYFSMLLNFSVRFSAFCYSTTHIVLRWSHLIWSFRITTAGLASSISLLFLIFTSTNFVNGTAKISVFLILVTRIDTSSISGSVLWLTFNLGIILKILRWHVWIVLIHWYFEHLETFLLLSICLSHFGINDCSLVAALTALILLHDHVTKAA